MGAREAFGRMVESTADAKTQKLKQDVLATHAAWRSAPLTKDGKIPAKTESDRFFRAVEAYAKHAGTPVEHWRHPSAPEIVGYYKGRPIKADMTGSTHFGVTIDGKRIGGPGGRNVTPYPDIFDVPMSAKIIESVEGDDMYEWMSGDGHGKTPLTSAIAKALSGVSGPGLTRVTTRFDGGGGQYNRLRAQVFLVAKDSKTVADAEKAWGVAFGNNAPQYVVGVDITELPDEDGNVDGFVVSVRTPAGHAGETTYAKGQTPKTAAGRERQPNGPAWRAMMGAVGEAGMDAISKGGRAEAASKFARMTEASPAKATDPVTAFALMLDDVARFVADFHAGFGNTKDLAELASQVIDSDTLLREYATEVGSKAYVKVRDYAGKLGPKKVGALQMVSKADAAAAIRSYGNAMKDIELGMPDAPAELRSLYEFMRNMLRQTTSVNLMKMAVSDAPRQMESEGEMGVSAISKFARLAEADDGTVSDADLKAWLQDPKNRKKAANKLYASKHKDFRGKLDDGTRTILMMVPGQGTSLVSIDGVSADVMFKLLKDQVGFKKLVASLGIGGAVESAASKFARLTEAAGGPPNEGSYGIKQLAGALGIAKAVKTPLKVVDGGAYMAQYKAGDGIVLTLVYGDDEKSWALQDSEGRLFAAGKLVPGGDINKAAAPIRAAIEKRKANPQGKSVIGVAEAAGGFEAMSVADVERLPVGSIVFPLKGGALSDMPLVTIGDGRLTPIAVLPKRAGEGEVDGDPAASFASSFTLVSKGSGKVQTHGVASKTANDWFKKYGAGGRAESAASKFARLTEADDGGYPTTKLADGKPAKAVKWKDMGDGFHVAIVEFGMKRNPNYKPGYDSAEYAGYVRKTVAIRLDGRKDKAWNVDIKVPPMPWEQADKGPLPSLAAAKAYALKWLDAAASQGTMTPTAVESVEFDVGDVTEADGGQTIEIYYMGERAHRPERVDAPKFKGVAEAKKWIEKNNKITGKWWVERDWVLSTSHFVTTADGNWEIRVKSAATEGTEARPAGRLSEAVSKFTKDVQGRLVKLVQRLGGKLDVQNVTDALPTSLGDWDAGAVLSGEFLAADGEKYPFTMKALSAKSEFGGNVTLKGVGVMPLKADDIDGAFRRLGNELGEYLGKKTEERAVGAFFGSKSENDRIAQLAESIGGLVEGTFTVMWQNDLTKTGGYRGTFETEEDAIEYAKREAKQSRSFAVFTVFKGTPKNPGAATKSVFRGEA